MARVTSHEGTVKVNEGRIAKTHIAQFAPDVALIFRHGPRLRRPEKLGRR